MMLARKTISGKLLRTCFVLLLMSALIRPAWAQQASGKLLVAYSGLVTNNASLWMAEDLDYLKSTVWT